MDYRSMPISGMKPVRKGTTMLEGFLACKSDQEKIEFIQSAVAYERSELLKQELTGVDRDFIKGVEISPWPTGR